MRVYQEKNNNFSWSKPTRRFIIGFSFWGFFHTPIHFRRWRFFRRHFFFFGFVQSALKHKEKSAIKCVKFNIISRIDWLHIEKLNNFEQFHSLQNFFSQIPQLGLVANFPDFPKYFLHHHILPNWGDIQLCHFCRHVCL